MIISFEGIDGCGKTTQIKLLNDYLVSCGKTTEVIRDPGSTVISEKIRNILLDKDNKISPLCELFLFLSARADMIDKKIKNDDTFYIMDRYIDSTMAYQGYGRGINRDVINSILCLQPSYTSPDITFFLDVPVNVSKERRGINLDRIESEDDIFFRKVRVGYSDIVRHNKRCIRIDGTLPQEEISKIIINIIDKIK